MSTYECTPMFGSDETTLQRTSTPIPGGKNCPCESFSSTTDKLLYRSWMYGLVRDSLDRLWNDDTLTTVDTSSGLHSTDLAGPATAVTSTKSPNVLAPILPATAGGIRSEDFPVGRVFPAEYAVGSEAGVFGNLPGNGLIAADYANCPPPGMNLVPGLLLIGANTAPVPGHASTGMNFPTIPAHAAVVPVPVGANCAIGPRPVTFAVPAPVPVGVIVTNGPAAVTTGANLVVGSVPTAVNVAAHYHPYPVGLGNFSSYQVLVQPFHTPSCNTALYCNVLLGCNPNGTRCLQPNTPLNGYV